LLKDVGAAGGIPVVASGTSAAIATTGDAHSGKRLVDVYYAVPSQYRKRNATWLMNSMTAKEVDLLVDNNKRPLVRELTAASLADGEPNVIKGKRVSIDEFMPDISANGTPIVFGDFGGYMIVDRVGFSVQRYYEVYAELNMTLLLARKRVGGGLIEPYRLRALKCAVS
jgi:HK97 family phage major capsid protein